MVSRQKADSKKDGVHLCPVQTTGKSFIVLDVKNKEKEKKT
jgi:hypothetical protein